MNQKIQAPLNKNLNTAQILSISSLFAVFLCTSVFAFTITASKSSVSSVQEVSKGVLSATNGSACSLYSKPTPQNTGAVNNGSMAVKSGSVKITADNTVIENTIINGQLVIYGADNVIIRNVIINGGGWTYPLHVKAGALNVLVENVTVTNGDSTLLYVEWDSSVRVKKSFFDYSTADAMKISTQISAGSIIETSYIGPHMGSADLAHADGIQSEGGGVNITFRGNTVEMPSEWSTRPTLGGSWKSNATLLASKTSNYVIECNWLNGGNYTIYDRYNTNIKILNNKFGRDSQWGLLSSIGSTSLVCGNVWENTGSLISENNSTDCSGTPSTTPPVTPPVTPPANPITINSRIQTTNNVNVNVRLTPALISTNILGTQPHGSTGTVIDGPTTANNIVWWKINYDTGADGWSGADNLIISNTVAPATTTPQTYTLATTSTNGIIVASPSKVSYTNRESVTLTAIPNTGYTFSGWSGDCSGTGSCVVTMTGTNLAKSVTANFTAAPQTYTLSYNGNGNTAGTVPASQTKTHNVNLTLATNSGTLAKTGYTFAGWNTNASGTGTSYAAGATYSANAGTTLYAQWTTVPVVQTYTLTTSTTGTGAGTITKSPNKATYTNEEEVTLTASPAAGSVFVGWSGDCSGTGSCTVSMTGNTTAKNVRAVFDTGSSTPTNPVATQDKILSISGPTSLEAGKTFNVMVKYDAKESRYLTLQLKTGASTIYVSESKQVAGAKDGQVSYALTVPSTIPTGTGYEYMVYMSSKDTWDSRVHYLRKTGVSVSTTVVPTYTLNITTPTNGTITKSPNQTSYTSGTSVVLTATPATGYQFSGWTGDCSGTNTTCNVAMTSVKTVSASFTLIPPVAATQDKILSISGPTSLEAGKTFNVMVKYDAKESRYLTLQLKTGASTIYVSESKQVAGAKDGQVSYALTVPSTIPTGTGYEYMVYMSSKDTWDSRVHYLRKTNLTVLAETIALYRNISSGYLSNTSTIFSSDLELGMTHPDVRTLQTYLNSNGYIVNPVQQEAGSPGYESNYFGTQTQHALMRFQRDNSIPVTGYFGVSTKNVMGR